MNRVSAALRGYLLHVLERNLPRRTKRLIFLASFSARVNDERAFDNATLEKLNRLMVLSASDSALKFPVHLSKVIWNGRTLTDICQDTFTDGQLSGLRIELASEQIVNKMPDWLRYGRRNDILNDVKKLLSNRADLFPQQQLAA